MATIIGKLLARLDLDNRNYMVGLRTADVGLRTFEKSVGRSSAVIKDFSVLLGGVGLSRLAAESVLAGENMIQLERRLAVLGNSMTRLGIAGAKPAELFQFLSESSDKMAVDFNEFNKTFNQLIPAAIATGVEFEKVKVVLKGTIGMANLMGASSQELARAFVAIRQVIGKDRLQMEELRQQLGEAMPNSMVIIAEGLTKVNAKTKELGDIGEITTAKLGKLIQTGRIDGNLFVRAWAAGVEKAAEFAEARAQMLSGQMTITKNIFERDVGLFMNNSGLNRYFAAVAMEANKALKSMFSDTEVAEKFGGAFIRQFESLTRGAAGILDVVAPAFSVIGETLQKAFDFYKTLPDELKAIGLIGVFLIGTKGKLVLLAAAALSDEIGTVVDRISTFWEDAQEDAEKGTALSFTMRALTSDIQNLNSVLGRSDLRGILEHGILGPIDKAGAEFLADNLVAVEDKIKRLGNIVPGQTSLMQRYIDTINDIGKADGIPNLARFLGFKEGKSIQTLNADLKATAERLLGLGVATREFAKGATDPVEAQSLLPGINKHIADIEALRNQLVALGDESSIATAALLDSSLRAFQQSKKEIEKLAVAIDLPAEDQIGEYERRWNSVLTIIRSHIPAIKQADDLLKSNTDLFNRLGKDERFKNIFATLNDDQIAAGVEKWLKQFDRLGEVSGVRKIEADFNALRRELELPIQNAFATIAGEVSGIDNALTQLLNNATVQAFEKLADTSASGTLEEVNAKFAEALETMDVIFASRLAALMRDQASMEFVLEAFNRMKERLTAGHEAALKRITDEQNRTAMQAIDDQVSRVKSIEDAYGNAQDALFTRLRNPALFAALGQKEMLEVSQGVRAQAGAIHTMTEEQLRNLVVQGRRRDIEEDLFNLELERMTFLDEETAANRQNLAMKQAEFELEKAIADLKFRQSAQGKQNALQSGRFDLLKELQSVREQRALLADREAGRTTIELEIERLKLQHDTNVQQMLLQQDEGVRAANLALEMQNLKQESENLQMELELLRDPNFVALQRQVELKREEVELQRLYNEYTMDLSTAIGTNLVDGVQSVTDTLSQGISDFITGMRSLKDIFGDFLKSAATGIVNLFSQWAAQWIVAQALQALGLAGMAATTTAAASAATAAWTPAAVAASIGTFGAALAFGPAAMAMIGASKVAATFGNILGSGGNVFHDGGIFTNGPKLPGFKSNEGLATLEEGELIIPEVNADAAIAAMTAAGVPLPAGVSAPSLNGFGAKPVIPAGSVGISSQSVDRGIVNSAAANQPQIVNFFDFEEVDRYMMRNPNAVLNIITQDKRNNGPTSRGAR